MIATAPPPIVNRIAGYGLAPPRPVPASPDDKAMAWGDALFAAAMFYQSRLGHPDPDVAERAARALFDLEKTRLRHGRELAGTTAKAMQPCETRERFAPLQPPDPVPPPAAAKTVARAKPENEPDFYDFDPWDDDEAAPAKLSFEANTDAELVDAAEKVNPQAFRHWVEEARVVTAKRGLKLSENELAETARTIWRSKMADLRAEYDRAKGIQTPIRG